MAGSKYENTRGSKQPEIKGGQHCKQHCLAVAYKQVSQFSKKNCLILKHFVQTFHTVLYNIITLYFILKKKKKKKLKIKKLC